MSQSRLAYVLPNLFTAASIFTGVLSMIKASQGDFVQAAWLIFLSLVFDGLDGRVARLTRTTSRFGVEFDSLADIIAFGVAPAMLIYFQFGHNYGRFGVLVSALYVIFGAIRLARFNVTHGAGDPNVFIGVPIPTAAVFVASTSLLLTEHPSLRLLEGTLLVLSLLVALLMVSNIRYPSFKKIDLRRPLVLKTLIVLTLLGSLLYLYPAEGFAAIILGYILYGPLRALKLKRLRIHSKE
ncbi:CDP-diacylglycerol--serine O-phosphatidyltransferase [Nitratifractor salsuginis]|uniref:CDP-diacylglycerol--serine O-phosphatidyltransferase n=1 Tax=Nitratifractor salsuginis (strain DSM 16511 / JCM 12458 / E9I37-1) TaxID=749222 RepID=E6X173_NITSE|nr:CDP-diacylglycerol--serine O-phosphatidyltransferase [Nitratifractor salsuginis]ADV46935.1 CDP-diacylglycerol--serine O-phosphatidyltransferase [Nitratifractor salsuginis DSM 16511]